jgi:hypothetical protein
MVFRDQKPNLRIDTDAQTAAFGRCLDAGHARRYCNRAEDRFMAV